MMTIAPLPPSARALQTRKTFPAVQESPLGTVQVADELGFAYLDGDIDFGATGTNEIFQNIKYIILTEYFSVPLDREFGMDYSMVDKPIPVAEAILSQEVAMKIALYEPRAQFRQIDFVRNILIGKLNPSVVVALISVDELPSMYKNSAAVFVQGIPKATVSVIAYAGEFSGTLTALPGPQGPQGPGATVSIGTTTTGLPGTDASVVNTGTPTDSILDFTIPRGEKGEPGTGVTIKGTVPNSASLPSTGNTIGDMWIASDTGHGWSWEGTQWIDVGPIQGPKGDAATIAVGTTATGAAGTNANVTNVGTSNAAVFNFTIPQGVTGAQGSQGNAGPPNVLTVQSTTTGGPGTNANVTISGVSPNQALAFTIPQGIQGPTGSQGTIGPTGPSNVLTVQSTATGAPGTNANVTISGTSPSQSLAFTIPQGIQGPQGLQGPTGPAGATPPLADVTQNGLLRRISGLTTDFVDGTNNCQGLVAAIQPTIWSVRLRSHNALGNPNFEVDQRNGGGAVSVTPVPGTNAWGADRWSGASAGTLRISLQQMTAATPTLIPGTSYAISNNILRATLTTAQASLGTSDLYTISQNVGGPCFRPLQSDVTSISFLARCSIANFIGVITLRDVPATRSYCRAFSMPATANTWTLITLPNVPVWPSGNFSAGVGANGYSLSICLAAGASYQTPSQNAWATGNYISIPGASNFAGVATGATFDLAFVQHEPGALCTSLIDVSFNDNYNDCLSYFHMTYNYGTIIGTSTGVGSIGCNALANQSPIGYYPYKRKLVRLPPTITCYSSVSAVINSVRDSYAAVNRGVTGNINGSDDNPGYPSLASTNTSPTIYSFHIVADTGW
jgi:phage baseplate assembly protein W